MIEGYGPRLLEIVIAARLTPLQRNAFIDAAVLERPHRDVAASAGVAPRAVSQALRTARWKIARVDGIRELAA